MWKKYLKFITFIYNCLLFFRERERARASGRETEGEGKRKSQAPSVVRAEPNTGPKFYNLEI